MILDYVDTSKILAKVNATVHCNCYFCKGDVQKAYVEHYKLFAIDGSGEYYLNIDKIHNQIQIAERLDIMPQEKVLPTAKDLRGLVPDFTGDMSTEDYIRSLRE